MQQLEETSSRTEMTKILAKLFGESTPADARLIAYLSAGQLGPGFDAPDFGVAEKQAIKAISRLTDKSVESLFKKTGDLGKTVEELSVSKSGDLTVAQVHARLLDVAQASGAGSQDKKQELIGELIKDVDPVSAKYVIKIILAKLRVGFSDMTVLDSLSWMITGDKKLRDEIEQMYNVRADLGEIAEELVKTKKPHLMQPELGTPILMAKAERATSAVQIWERNNKCAVEYKLDGLRIQAHVDQKKGVKLFSRGLEEVSAMYPDIVAGLLRQIKHNCIVEGEMIAVDGQGKTLEFKKTMNRKRKYDIDAKVAEIPMSVFLFDLLWLDGKSVIAQTNKERWETLKLIVKTDGVVKLMPRITVESSGEIDTFFNKALAEGMEGIVAKRLNSPYTPGNRDFSWIKMKPVLDSVDVVVLGYSAGEGKRTDFGIGEFLVGVYEPKSDRFQTVSKVGSGATDAEWVKLRQELEKLRVAEKPERYDIAKQYIQDYWVRPKLVLEVVASEISESPAHTSGFGLRFPRLIAWRDKKPEDATTVAEIEKMFKLNKKGGDN